MTTNALKHLPKHVDDFIRDAGKQNHARRARIFKNRCYTVDFDCHGTAFAFDFVPAANDTVSLDFVPRGDSPTSAAYNAEARTGKRRVIDEAPIDIALKAFASKLARVEDLIKSPHLDNPLRGVTETTVENTATDLEGALTVGVMTLPLSANFGNNLQAFALIDTLRRMGHRTVLINRRRPPKDYVENDAAITASRSRALFIDYADQTPRYLPKVNARFVDRHIGHSTPAFVSSQQLTRNIDRYDLDAVIVGSDQTWRPNYASTLLSDFFLGFLDRFPRDIRRISYAASFGADRWEYGPEAQRTVAPLLQKFDAVSVREDNAVELCRTNLGRDAVHVLDPTMLVSPDRYVEVFSEIVAPHAEDRLVTYILDPTSDKDALLATLSQHLGLPIYSTNGRPYTSGDPLKDKHGDNSVERWLASIHGSRFVVTDSFHGMVFAIIFKKPFIVYANPRRGMARFTSLLGLLGLERRLVTTAPDMSIEQALQPIDWRDVDERLRRMRQSSMEFLQRALAPKTEHAASSQDRSRTHSQEIAHNAPVSTSGGFVDDARRLALLDSKRYSAAYLGGDPAGKLRAVLMFDAHALEKGLSHTSFRPGFGKRPLARLAEKTTLWLDSGNDLNDPFFLAATAALRAYFERHRALHVNVAHLWRLFPPRIQDLIASSDSSQGGALRARQDRETVPPIENSKSFMEVAYGRRSVREFTPDPVDIEAIKQAVRIASQAPSVCNRQAPRVHYFRDRETISRLVDLQGGFSGYPKPPGLLLVTCDLTAFIYHTERNQGYIDGGLFMMTLLLGLEQVGLGACPLNAAMDARRERAIREIISVPESEAMISFVAVGHYDPAVLVARSLRYPVEEVLSVHGE
ncbi:hypothetical protein GI374_16705 [Paracoccus sp. S-4012]|uniref:polysaccharide pyruvyl transferase family protein n=1 Tax=Paracoccus sp. S-4012 TaxID=2665648 RepID=UPI0012B045FE|nr:polysaccharide pyruvyl transferase family protein [Paracoccus sp. S-4012]MRX52020.1 hypothetical protein [Paracoccus sp. S-4012]